MVDSDSRDVLGGCGTEQRKDAGSVHTLLYGRDRGRSDATVRSRSATNTTPNHRPSCVRARGESESTI